MLTTFAGAASGKAQHVSWDIISLTATATTLTFDPGGFAEAETPSPAGVFGPIETIRMTGHGTFVAPASGHGSGAATGGGTWTIGGAPPQPYEVTALLSWEFAGVQTTPPGVTITDNTGDVNERANGTAVLRIEFSNGQSGILTVGCHGPGAPNHIFEGIATTKGFKTYYDVHDPVGGVDANRTIFHVSG